MSIPLWATVSNREPTWATVSLREQPWPTVSLESRSSSTFWGGGVPKLLHSGGHSYTHGGPKPLQNTAFWPPGGGGGGDYHSYEGHRGYTFSFKRLSETSPKYEFRRFRRRDPKNAQELSLRSISIHWKASPKHTFLHFWPNLPPDTSMLKNLLNFQHTSIWRQVWQKSAKCSGVEPSWY